MAEKLSDLLPDSIEDIQKDNKTPLQTLEKYFERFYREATETIEWYYRHKRRPAFWARVVRWTAIVISAVGGLFPIWRGMITVKSATAATWSVSGDLGYALLATAAALIAIDRFGGLSSAWMRYITTAQAVTRAQRAFQLDWREARLAVPDNAANKDLQPLFKLLRDFAAKHDEIVETETRTWIAEFRSVLAELGRTPKKEEPAPPPPRPADDQKRTPPRPAFGAIRLNIKDGDRVADKLIVERDGVKKEWDKSAQLLLTDVKAGEEPQFTVRGVIDGKNVVWDVPATKVVAGETVDVSVDPQP